ncbi:hypothetical protein, partial [Nocardia cyriacigeorgica]|uniref:hypothetical protein n=1 Tax=Nocardia cyriacigeorgica TaxID=135487 RepID=UPI002456733D
MRRSIDLVVGMYAVSVAGGAYVPLDPDHPAERTVQKLALAVFYDRTRESDVLTHLDKELAPWASEVVRTCNSGAHG